MAQVLLISVIVCLSIIGITEIIKCISFLAVAPKTDTVQNAVIVPDERNVECEVRAFAERCRWDFYSDKTKTVVLNSGLSKESEEVVRRLLLQYEDVEFLSAEEFSEKLKKGTENV